MDISKFLEDNEEIINAFISNPTETADFVLEKIIPYKLAIQNILDGLGLNINKFIEWSTNNKINRAIKYRDELGIDILDAVNMVNVETMRTNSIVKDFKTSMKNKSYNRG